MSRSSNGALDGIKDIIVNVIVGCVLVFIFGICYLKITVLQRLVPGYTDLSWVLIKLSVAVFTICLILINTKKIILYVGKLILTLIKSMFRLLKFGVKKSRNIKVTLPQVQIPSGNKGKSDFGKGLPPIALLGDPSNYRESKSHAENTKNTLNKSFKDFALDCSVSDYQMGPTITRYYVTFSSTTKIRELTAVKEDLAARIRTRKLRISTSDGIVIEIPNIKKQKVLHRDIMEELLSEDLPQLAMACGRTVNGGAYYIDLAKTPHLMVGGVTGGGKSVCINSLIISLLMRNSPDDLKLIMVDPKVIEFEFYVGLPHLLFPVANTLEKSAELIKWCVEEMNRRYLELKKLKKKSLSDIPVKDRPFPVIALVVDELAEITMSKRAGELTEDLCSLARMARAAGIHMILATQRPDKDAIPGQLKFNIPSAISLAVSKDYESRIILGQEGAEKLTGKGDMLVKTIDEEEPVRCQGSFLEDWHIENIVEWWKQNHQPQNFEYLTAIDNEENEEIMPKINFTKKPVISCEEPQKEPQNENQSITLQAELTLRKNICEFRIVNNDAEIQIPTIRDLSEQLNISVKSVYKILELLRQESWIKTIGTNRYAKTIVTLSYEDAEEWIKNFQ